MRHSSFSRKLHIIVALVADAILLVYSYWLDLSLPAFIVVAAIAAFTTIMVLWRYRH